jgi:hypothetical protein
LGEEGGRWNTGPRRNQQSKVAASAQFDEKFVGLVRSFTRERKREGRGGPGLFIGDRCLAGGGRVRVRGGDRWWGHRAHPGPLLEEEGESITRAPDVSEREKRRIVPVWEIPRVGCGLDSELGRIGPRRPFIPFLIFFSHF